MCVRECVCTSENISIYYFGLGCPHNEPLNCCDFDQLVRIINAARVCERAHDGAPLRIFRYSFYYVAAIVTLYTSQQ